jgi:predicted DNA-binding transcriptional regulator AlpA
MDQYLTVKELAHREQVAIQTVYGWNYRKSGPRYTRIGLKGGGVRYRLADVVAWEETQLTA